MANFAYGGLRQSYAALWKAMQIPTGVRVQATDARVRAIAEAKPRYDQVANATGVPWYVIGIIHEMEGGLNFATHLHNGDPLAGRTVQVPAGRPPTGIPPFQWEESAIDALTLEAFHSIKLWTDRAHRLPARGLQRLGLSLAQHRRQHALPVERHQQLPEGQVRARRRVRCERRQRPDRSHGAAAPPDRHGGHQRAGRGRRAAARHAVAAERPGYGHAALSRAWPCASTIRTRPSSCCCSAGSISSAAGRASTPRARPCRSTRTETSGSSRLRPSSCSRRARSTARASPCLSTAWSPSRRGRRCLARRTSPPSPPPCLRRACCGG